MSDKKDNEILDEAYNNANYVTGMFMFPPYKPTTFLGKIKSTIGEIIYRYYPLRWPKRDDD